MGDLGRPVEFGGNVDPTAADPSWPLRLTRTIEDGGLTWVGIQDHPYNVNFLDTWTLLATLAQATSRVGLFPNVANLPLRPPAMLAKAVASLDVLSGGRIELGLGAGAVWEGIAAMGGPTRRPGEAVAALEEAIQIIRLFWYGTLTNADERGKKEELRNSPRAPRSASDSGERSVRFEGQHYALRGARPGPPPAHAVGIWLGAYKPRMLELTGRLADGWIPSMGHAPPEQIPEMQRRIDEAALAAGRQPQDIRRAYNVGGRIGAVSNASGRPQGAPLLEGPVPQWIEVLTGFVLELGMDTFIFWPSEDRMRQMELFAAEVAPGVREAVE